MSNGTSGDERGGGSGDGGGGGVRGDAALVRVERVELKGRRLGEIVLDRAEKRNAMTAGMLRAAIDGARELSRDDAVGAIVVRGEGEVFCAGFDLALCVREEGTLGELLRLLSELIGVLKSSPKPVVIGVQGAAMAGAAALLAAGDAVVADAGAKIGYPVVRLGISPAVSAGSLSGAIGGGAARARLLNTEVVDGERARELGWVSALVPVVEDVRPRAQVEAARLADKPAGALARTKAWVNELEALVVGAEAVRLGLEASLSLVGSDEERALLGRVFGVRGR
ncbi:MAG: enoyl-CoA hydratase/isomerase family protein [Phycisphaerales bacterium]